MASKWLDHHQRQDYWKHDVFIEVATANHLVGEGCAQLDRDALLRDRLLKDLAKDLPTRNINPDDEGDRCQEEHRTNKGPGWHARIDEWPVAKPGQQQTRQQRRENEDYDSVLLICVTRGHLSFEW